MEKGLLVIGYSLGIWVRKELTLWGKMSKISLFRTDWSVDLGADGWIVKERYVR